MDEPAQCCCGAYAAAANGVRCWQIYLGRALVTVKILHFGVERSKNVHGERKSNKKIQPNLTEEFSANGYQTNISTKSYRGILQMYLWYYRGKFGGCRQILT